jgi:hypothetical protein
MHSRYGVGIGDDIYILVYGNFLRFNWAFIQAPGVWIHVYAYVVGVIALATVYKLDDDK